LGTESPNFVIASYDPEFELAPISYTQTIGDKNYELSNHLGNVLQVVTDRKLAVDDGEFDLETYTYTSATPDGIIDYFTADVVSQSDYYPFGMMLPGRNSSDDSYRYGFQGQEMDDELKGEGNSVNYKYRMHDPRIGRFFAVDPLASKYPYMTPYQFAGNKPIWSREIEGLESEVDVKAGVQISIGNIGNSSIKAFAGIGLTTNTGGSVQGNFGVGFSLYSGGIGTNQGTTGKSSFNLDLNFSAGATGGGVTGTSTSVNNYYQGSGISLQNPFQNSFSLGAVGTLSSNMASQLGRNQVSGYLGTKFGGNTTLSTYNDIFSGPLNNDSYWTGGFEAKSTFGETSVSLTYDGFTGARPNQINGVYPEIDGNDGFCYYNCGTLENEFNNGQTMLKVNNTNFSFGVGHIGNGLVNGQWLQNAIHDNWPISNPFKWGSDPINRFENSSKESLIFQGGAGIGL
jgi:RHS repeat-associated protein